MRTLTGGASGQATALKGAEPINVIKIAWTSGTVYYADKDVTIGSTVCQGRIVELGSFNIQQKEVKRGAQYNAASLASCSVILDDTKSSLPSLKSIWDSQILEKTPVVVYQYFGGLVLADLVPIITGYISSPMVWDEAKRLLQFDVVSKIDDNSVSYASDGTDIANINKNAIGKPWPLVFGAPINVPAVKIKGTAIGTLKQKLTNLDSDGTDVLVNKGSDFPQLTPILVSIGTTVYNVTFNGDKFTINTNGANVAKYTNLVFAARVNTDADNNNAKVAWLVRGDANIVGMNCYIGVQQTGSTLKVPQVNYCYKQEGTKCYFLNNWVATNGVPVKIDNLHSEQIDEVASLYRKTWSSNTIIFKYGFNWEYTTTLYSWWWSAGSEVRQVGVVDVFVANLISSSVVIDVMAFCKIPESTTPALISVPASLYTVNLSDSYAVVKNGVAVTLTPTTITFPTSLRDLVGNWQPDQIFVTLRSSQGPNVSDIIKYLIQTYTPLTVDTASFSTVQGYLTNYPANFALLQNENVMKAIEEIAWQSRCGIRIEAALVSIVYLSKAPASLVNIDETLIALKSISLKPSELDDVYTYIVATFRTEYMSDDQIRKRQIQTATLAKRVNTDDDVFKLIYTNNVVKFGYRPIEHSFYIYNISSLVQKSLNFWGHRLSNIFRKVNFTAYLDLLAYEIFDAVTFNLTASALIGNMIGTIEEQKYEPKDGTIGFQVGLASIAGTLVQDALYWMSDVGDTLPTDPASKVTATLFPNELIVNIIPSNTGTIGMDNGASDSPSGPIQLGVITGGTTPTYNVDVYDNGFSNPSTASITATLVGAGSPAVNDQIVIHNNSNGAYFHVGNGGGNVASARGAWGLNITIAAQGVGTTYDGTTLVDGDSFFLFGQTTASENGLYTVHDAGHNGGTWVKNSTPDQIFIKEGTIFSGERFTLTATSTFVYTMKMVGIIRADYASSNEIIATTAGTRKIDGINAPANNSKVLLYAGAQTKIGLWVVQTGNAWLFLGTPDCVSVNGGTTHAGYFVNRIAQTQTYVIYGKNAVNVDYGTTSATTPGVQTGGFTGDGASSLNSVYVLLMGDTSSNGLWYVTGGGIHWVYLGTPDQVYVKNGTSNGGKLFVRNAATNLYTAVSLGGASNTTKVVSVTTALTSPTSEGISPATNDKVLYQTGGAGSVYTWNGSAYVFDKIYDAIFVLSGGNKFYTMIYDPGTNNYFLTYSNVHV